MFKYLIARFCPVAFLLLSGCTAVPTVKYSLIERPTDITSAHFDSFNLQESTLKLDAPRDSKTGQVDMAGFSVTAVPIEHSEFKLALTHSNMWGVKTTLNITKRENTDLVREIGSEVTDQRVELIGKIGGVLSKAVGFVTGIVSSDDLPMVIPTLPIMVKNGVDENASALLPAGNGVNIEFRGLPKDARPIAQMPLSTRTSVFLYAACRSAVVQVALPNNITYKKTVKVADPRYFQSVRFPLKGKITAHSECGVSVASDASTGIKSSADIADAAIAQVIAIQQALEAKKKEEK